MKNKSGWKDFTQNMPYLVVFLVTALRIPATAPAYAGNVDNQNNYSAEWVRTLNRNAATDSADAAAYNPAGTVRMRDGLYLNLTGQYVYKKYSHELNGTEYESDTPSYLPGVFGVYKNGRWAAFATYTIACGGGKVEYDAGTATTATIARWLGLGNGDRFLQADSYYHTVTLGGACALNGRLSVSLGIRFVDAELQKKASAGPYHLDYKETDHGWGAVLGLDFSPADKVNIGLRYETRTRLNLRTRVRRDDLGLLTNRSKRRRDLPAVVGLGMAYRISSRLRTETNLTYYMNGSAHWDDNPLSMPADESKKSDGYDLGIAFEYTFSPGMKASAGYMFTDTGLDPDDMCIEAPELNAHTLCGGLGLQIIPGLDINFGMAKVFYVGETTSYGLELDKDIYLFALGIQYSL